MRSHTYTLPIAIAAVMAMGYVPASAQTTQYSEVAIRLPGNPIVSPATDPTGAIGTNINGPSLIRAPQWLGSKPLGRYYLYFADHNGKYIRMAYADRLSGPWKIYSGGVLPLQNSYFTDHIASPEAIVDPAKHEIRLYYHGLTKEDGTQHTRVAISSDGIHFTALKEPAGKSSAYWRLFRYKAHWYALAMPGRLLRSIDGIAFELGPQLFDTHGPNTIIHSAVKVDGDTLTIYYTRTGDSPERIFRSTVDLKGDWNSWKPTAATELLAPEMTYEGADLPITASRIGAVDVRIRALRDPAVFQEDGKTYLLYAIAGESGIAIAELKQR